VINRRAVIDGSGAVWYCVTQPGMGAWGQEADLIAAHCVPARWPVPDRASGGRVADMAAPSTGGFLVEPPPEFNVWLILS